MEEEVFVFSCISGLLLFTQLWFLLSHGRLGRMCLLGEMLCGGDGDDELAQMRASLLGD